MQIYCRIEGQIYQQTLANFIKISFKRSEISNFTYHFSTFMCKIPWLTVQKICETSWVHVCKVLVKVGSLKFDFAIMNWALKSYYFPGVVLSWKYFKFFAFLLQLDYFFLFCKDKHIMMFGVYIRWRLHIIEFEVELQASCKKWQMMKRNMKPMKREIRHHNQDI